MTPTTCAAGVLDCALLPSGSSEICAEYDGAYRVFAHDGGTLALGAIIAALMAFCLGGNDSANSWASSVGSGAIGLRRGLLLGGFGEWLGATLLGYGVSGTIQKGVADTDAPECWACGYCDSKMSVYNVGMLGALIGAACFLLLATFGKMPVSTTHAIVGGVVGMTLVGTSASCLNWSFDGGLSSVIASWVLSPALAGVFGVVIYFSTRRLTVLTASPRRNALRLLPLLYALSTFVMVLLVMLKSKPTKELPPYVMVASAVGAAVVAALVVHFVLVPRVAANLPSAAGTAAAAAEPTGACKCLLRFLVGGGKGGANTTIERGGGTPAIELTDLGKAAAPPPTPAADVATAQSDEEADAIFAFRNLLVFVAFLESFAHGANDTANATAAFAAMYNAHEYGLAACAARETPWWIMSLAGLCVALGVNLMGYRVIQTMGNDLTAINFMLGYSIECASTLTVVIATVVGMPVSSTHCQVGAVVFIGAASGGANAVSWKTFGKIGLSWVLTLPFAGGLAAAITAIGRTLIVS